METIIQWVAHYGYAAIFCILLVGVVGLPMPDEWLLAFAGYLVFKEKLQLGPTIAVATLGSMCGITISYFLGRSMGFYALRKFAHFLHISPEGLDRTRAWYSRFGTSLLFFGYFIPGVRHLTAAVAGTLQLRFSRFAMCAYPGALVWVSTFIGVGHLLGERWTAVLRQVHERLQVIAWLAAAAVVLWLLWLFLGKKFQRKK